jgi:hypothetical protein
MSDDLLVGLGMNVMVNHSQHGFTRSMLGLSCLLPCPEQLGNAGTIRKCFHLYFSKAFHKVFNYNGCFPNWLNWILWHVDTELLPQAWHVQDIYKWTGMWNISPTTDDTAKQIARQQLFIRALPPIRQKIKFHKWMFFALGNRKLLT